MPNIKTGKFVHVVGSVDLAGGTGKILYVNPSSVSAKPLAEPASADNQGAAPPVPQRFELVVENAEGAELARLHPAILLPSDTDTKPRSGLIDEDIPFMPGMSRLVLLYDGERKSVYEAGAPPPEPGNAGAAPGLSFGAAPPGHPNKRAMTLDGHAGPQPGVTYTVQVKPSGHRSWQTIAVGRSTPEFQIDRNQFPGSDRASVRVLRTTGFEDQVVAEHDIKLEFGE